jgi:hypothetical protein
MYPKLVKAVLSFGDFTIYDPDPITCFYDYSRAVALISHPFNIGFSGFFFGFSYTFVLLVSLGFYLWE